MTATTPHAARHPRVSRTASTRHPASQRTAASAPAGSPAAMTPSAPAGSPAAMTPGAPGAPSAPSAPQPTAIDLLPRPESVRLIDENGTHHPDAEYATPSPERLLEAYRGLVLGRRLNDQCSALVRQGRLAVYPSSHGQEACQIGIAQALAPTDWMFPTYRDSVALIARGVAAEEAFLMLRGDWHCGYNPNTYRVAPQATPLATQLLHATGFAHAARLKGEDTVAIALTGDGATSEGDFHEALNFAAVYKAPVVFFVQNNEFAISVPLDRQTAAPSLAHKGIGYGIPGERVDGNDVAAVLSVLDRAIARARRGDGPTLIEAHTYRMLAHTNADDDTRYRDRADVEAWKLRDPLTRLKTYLTNAGHLSEDLDAEFTAAADAAAAELRAALNADSNPDPRDLFAHVYATPTPQLEAQWSLLAEEIALAEGARA